MAELATQSGRAVLVSLQQSRGLPDRLVIGTDAATVLRQVTELLGTRGSGIASRPSRKAV
jgi:hypothetical protein